MQLKKAIKTDSRYYIFMEFCNGNDLKELMEVKGWKIAPETVQKIMKQLCHGFKDMMDVLVLHRDLKLQNIIINFPDDTEKILAMSKDQKKAYLRDIDLLTTNFEIKIADFGFSKKLKHKGHINKTICGTPLYMAPQVVMKKEYSYKSDVWSIGVILFELLNGLTPFHSRNKVEFEGKVEASKYNFKESVKQNLTIECISFMSHCLQHAE